MKHLIKTAASLSAAIFLCAGALAENIALDFAPEQFEPRQNALVDWNDGVLTLKISDPEWSGGVAINPPQGEKFDFSMGRYLACDVKNLSEDSQMRLTMHISSGTGDSKSDSHVELPRRECKGGIGLNPGEERTLRIYLPHANLFKAPGDGKNMRVLDTEKINSIEFKIEWPFETPKEYLVDCEISNFRLEGEPEYGKKIADSENYFPFIDRYGQYAHSEWPEKIRSDEDLVENRKREQEKLDKTPAIASWNKYGGWAKGPKLEATGNFRVEKYEDKWYFVDPEGCLFWSLGIDVMQAYTDPSDRLSHPHWYAADIPQEDSLPFPYWNLQKKYEKPDPKKDFYETLARRMEAWGINTIGNWSNSELMALGQRPYTVNLGELIKGFPRFENQKVKFYDVFDPKFEERMGNVLAERAAQDSFILASINDPMCIGYFIDNELNFGQIIGATVKAEPTQPAKLEFVKDLKQKYGGSIENLNKSWETSFADWDALLANKSEPKSPGFREDANEFNEKFIDRYFEICRRGVKSAAPHRLYLGNRIVGFRQGDHIWKAAAKHCDVVSVNTYVNSVFGVSSERMLDKPVIIGEFHFGVVDRGMFMPGLVPVGDQKERAVSFTRFIQGALLHPNIVGAHWFQLRDQPLTGRWDGEGYQIGFIDVADTPYEELCDASREAGKYMYKYRTRGKLLDKMR